VDAHRPVREHLSAHVRGGQVRIPDARTRPKLEQTHPSRLHSREIAAQIVATAADLAGGSSGALQTDLPTCVTNAFSTPSRGCDRLSSRLRRLGQIDVVDEGKAGDDFNASVFPTIKAGSECDAVPRSAGDMMVAFRDTPAIGGVRRSSSRVLLAAEAWGEAGRLRDRQQARAGEHLSRRDHPCDRGAVGTAKSVVFDMSDEQPPSFGCDHGPGEWALPEVPPEPEGRERDPEAARVGRSGRPTRRASNALSAGGIAAEPQSRRLRPLDRAGSARPLSHGRDFPGAAPRPAQRLAPSTRRSTRSSAASSARPATGKRGSGSTTTRRVLDVDVDDGDQEQRALVAVVPALVTSFG